jgi:2-polyprenyl-3-methyl-5-hydroxy-6-metoxy-1,4-benzoquinol methylase
MRDTLTNKLIVQKWAAPDQNILKKIKTTKWTSHNIPLTQSESTMNINNVPLIGDDTRTKTIKKNLYMLVSREGSLSGLRLIDLGCLEGGVAFEMAREDMHVIGVEGRKTNYAKCRLIEDYFALPNLQFLFLDVKNLNKTEQGIFDVVLCLGLLYHLVNPFSFLNTLNEMTHEKSLVFLDTHIAPADPESYDFCIFKDVLSDITQLEYEGRRYQGRWYQDLTKEDHEWASVSNYRSFWLTQTSLIEALYFAGFKNIYNLYGFTEIGEEFDLRKKYSRLWCIALKESRDGLF